MAYRIQETAEHVEVHVLGESSQWEVLQIIATLSRLDPRKERSDIWFFAEDTIIPLAAFQEIAKMTGQLCRAGFVGAKSAIVTTHELQWLEVGMYTHEAASLPFKIGVFRSRDEAMAWIKA